MKMECLLKRTNQSKLIKGDFKSPFLIANVICLSITIVHTTHLNYQELVLAFDHMKLIYNLNHLL